MADPVKLSSPATGEFFEIPVLFEDAHLFALAKPPGLLVSPDADEPARASLMALLHAGIERGTPWAKSRGLGYLVNAHRIDAEVSGVLLLAKDKTTLNHLVAQFSTHEPTRTYAALVRGTASEDTYSTEAKLAPHPLQMGVMRVDPDNGKRSQTAITVRERFQTCILLGAQPVPDRQNQVRVHLKYLRLPVVGDNRYGGKPLFLSRLKSNYTLKKDQVERPLLDRPAVHLEEINIKHPATGEPVKIEAPWAKDLTVAVKYLRRYSGGNAPAGTEAEE